ncbi:alcohol dehydrogenase catalytic domain-containing protein [Streptomyces sp. 3MP-14]|uniref:alcohol dehydrogenase (NADP(+)) n=1 Tax=Streptomyces mimosae TaxID=2586635 RepID=A0A5N6A690_9ACTN|nr:MULTISPECIES: NAD(P)-dependent alcohol dehydrogenase [Streptomyces]KAB8163436.1 alcohol dehydrogenase catalytic domain-containing protein [Streptomyces mimosae]KAB8174713.1 alcohol dehydrogenase catalytic domain-containing protein [Streptomyces sp. 3MP-14]
MSTEVLALSAPAPHAPLATTTIPRRTPGDHDVVIDIEYTGICHTDLALLREEWGAGPLFPMVPGHEIVGRVAEAGASVSRHAVGDRVGVGCYVDSCRACVNCEAGEEQHCLRGEVITFGGLDYAGERTYGGYSRRIVVDERYALRVPDALDPRGAAPLLCAGISMYNPLRRWRAGPGRRVAIVGLGGLGHLGVQLADAMGAEVTVLGRTLGKRADGLRLGAVDYRATGDPATFEELAGGFDLIVNTVGAGGDLDGLLGLLALDGVLVNAGVSVAPSTLHQPVLGAMRRVVTSTKNGGLRQCQEMLDFCAEHGIEAETELVEADRINEALDRLDRGDVRYRFVIDLATLAPGR